MMTEPLVYLRGEMVPASQARLQIYDAGVVLGATVTEMVRTFKHQLFRLQPHLDRLARGIKYLRFDIGMEMSRLGEICQELTAHNSRLISAEDELGLVIFITPGELPVYAGGAGATAHNTPTVCVHTFPMPFELWSEKFRTGQHFVTPSIRHVPPQCYDPNMKYRSRMHYYLADQEAKLVDPAAAALLLDLDGNVTETGGANFLMVEKGTIVSPTLRNILPGVSRAVVRELAGKLDIPFVEKDFAAFHALNADEAFTASTPYCILPVTRLNGLPVGKGVPGPIFQKLIEGWNKEVGLDVIEQFCAGASRRTGAAAKA